MTDPSTWPTAGRIIWLAGGIVAYSNAGENAVQVCAGANGKQIKSLTIGTYGAVYERLRHLGLPVIGTSFVVHPDEVEGYRPAEFRAAGANGNWPYANTVEQWRRIVFGAGKVDSMQVMDISSRISSGLRYGQLRLYDLVFSYAMQLRAVGYSEKIKESQAFKDRNSFEVYKAIHALFWELAVLRDTLAEFAAKFCFSNDTTRTFSGVLKLAKKSQHVLARDFERMGDKSKGWVAQFSCFRDFFTHVAPLEMAAGFAFTVQDLRCLEDGSTVPQIYYPLPGDIEELTRQRSAGAFFSTFEELARASTSRRDRNKDLDALDYLHGALNQFADLATELIQWSPIKPEPIKLGPEDIIGPITWKSPTLQP